jgi:transcriptional regulator with XRE-family HTH domain
MLGQALRELRTYAGLTQQQLAQRAASDYTYISRVERGRIDIGWSTLLRLLRALDASLGDLVDAIEHQEARH